MHLLFATTHLDYATLVTLLVGGLALFLYGMQLMTESLGAVAGGGLRKLLCMLTANRFTAALAGALITAVIQSSSITTVLVVGLISSGVMTFAQSIGVILGANVGTTITAQVIAFDISKYGLLAVAAGFCLQWASVFDRLRLVGQTLLGLGLVLFGMELMTDATYPLRTYEPFLDVMQNLSNPVIAASVGALVTALIQSSSATTGMVIVLGSQGLVGLETAIAIVLGANVGTCVTAVLSALGAPREAMKAAVVHVLFNVGGVLLWIGFVPLLASWVARLSSGQSPEADLPRQIANAHTLFNLLNLVLFIGFIHPLARLAELCVPQRRRKERKWSLYLDPFFFKAPGVAVVQVEREMGILAQRVREMVSRSLALVTYGTRQQLIELRRCDQEIDQRHREIVEYLRELSRQELGGPDSRRVTAYLAIASYLEQVADVVETNLVADGEKRAEHQIVVSEPTYAMFQPVHAEVLKQLDRIAQSLGGETLEPLEAVVASKPELQAELRKADRQLARRLVADEPHRLRTFQFESDLLENLSRIHTLLRRVARVRLGVESGEETEGEVESAEHGEIDGEFLGPDQRGAVDRGEERE